MSASIIILLRARLKIVPYLLRKITVETNKQQLAGNGFVARNNEVVVGSGIFCVVRVLA
jgi:hypothetical protein